ncbi:T9SS type A sorting domain-containing protein, partial [bacterium]|nr:T9SS type A sorting domain-containing protein [bacterium]
NSVHGIDALGGGGVVVSDQGRVRIKNNRITHNTVTSATSNGLSAGGGIGIFNSPDYDCLIVDNEICFNTADNTATPLRAYGGGIFLLSSVGDVRNNLFKKNRAQLGGAIAVVNWNAGQNASNHFSSLDLPGLRKNSAIAAPLIKQLFINNTLVKNTATHAGAIFSELATPMILNCILWDNPSETPNYQTVGNMHLQYSCVQDAGLGHHNIYEDPVFADSINYFLDPGASPCIDAGNPAVEFNDMEDPAQPGQALFPALGTLRNDMGAYGGNAAATLPGILLTYGQKFNAFLQRTWNAPIWQRNTIVDSFLTTVSEFPFTEDSTYCVFIYTGNVTSVTVPGDANGWNGTAFPMRRISGTTFWYYGQQFEPDTRLDYKFVVDHYRWILDPRNPRTVTGGYGPNSELTMPGFVDPPEIEYYPNIPHGTVKDTVFTSTSLGRSRPVTVYLPPGYESAPADSFPLILFHDGQDYQILGSVMNILDYLIHENRIQPVIGVLVRHGNIHRENEYATDETAEFESFIMDEVLPVIDQRYRTRKAPQYRAMTGPSYGGLITTQICYHHPEQFGLCAPVSPSYWAKDMVIFHEVTTGPKKNLTFFLDWGKYETGIALDARLFRDTLLAKGYPLVWHERHDGHSWGNWRAHLDEILEYFFPASGTNVLDADKKPADFELQQNYPNPFNPETTIQFSMPNTGPVKLTIYDAVGRITRTLLNAELSAGTHTVRWNGMGENGTRAASGLYFCRLEAGPSVNILKMMLLK